MTDTVQTWQYRIEAAACEIGEAVNILVTETLDFDTMTMTVYERGIQEGGRVNSTETFPIRDGVSADGAEAYRQRNNYTRIS